MKKRYHLPEHQPSAGAWDSLLDSQKLDRQLKKEIPNLPSAELKKDIWPLIAGALEQQAGSSIPLRKYTAIAVFLIVFLGTAVLVYNGGELSFKGEYLVTKSRPAIEVEVGRHFKDLPKEKRFPMDTESSHPNVEKLQSRDRITEISVNKPSLGQKDWHDPGLVVAVQPAPVSPKKTLHEVDISWGPDKKFQIGIGFANTSKILQDSSALSKVRKSQGEWVFRLSKVDSKD
mgnify:CR=1 FL=1